MNKDILTILDDNNEQQYRLLFIIDNDYKYIVYTDKDNTDIHKNIFAIKVKSLNNNEECLPITNDEWNMIKEECEKLIKK